MLVKDEADVIGHTIAWLKTQVDHIIVMDNLSTDGTREIIEESGVQLLDDHEVAYYQSAKTTKMARMALEQGHQWVLPCDADEIWHTGDIKVPIRDWVAGVTDCQVIRANLFHHWPSIFDRPETENPIERICWRSRVPGSLPKVMARTAGDLVIDAGNHGAKYLTEVVIASGLNIRHFSWRTEQQYLTKIRNGELAYAATTLDPSIGEHWRQWENKTDEEILGWYRRWALRSDPGTDETLIYDPAPLPV